MTNITSHLKRIQKDTNFIRASLISCVAALGIALFVGIITMKPLFSIIDADFANLFLATTAQVLAGTTAIIFTVSALTISIASDRYTAQLLSRFITDPLTIWTFFILLACMLIALFAVGTDTPMDQGSFLFMVFLVSMGIGLLLFYLYHTLAFIRPDALVDELYQEGLQALKDEDTGRWNEIVSSMGDITLKAIARNEENVAITYIEGLRKLQIAWANSSQTPLHRPKDKMLAAIGFEVRSPIFNQYKRALDKLAKGGDENLVIAIRNAESKGIENLLQQRPDKQILQGLLSQYQELVEMVVNSQHSARFVFLYAYRSMIWQRFNQTSQDELLPIVLHGFVNACEVVVNKDDRELFDRTLYYFCSGYSSLNDAIDSLKTYELPQLYYRLPNSYEWGRPWSALIANTTRPYLTSNTYIALQGFLTSFSDILKDDEQGIICLQQVQNQVQKIFVTTQLIDTFIQLGIKVLASDKLDFLKILWTPHPSDPYMNRVPLNLELIISRIIRYAQYAERFAHDQQESTLILQYCFLYFAYALQQANKKGSTQQLFSLPPVDKTFLSQSGNLPSLVITQIKTIYEILASFPRQLETIAQQYDVVIHDTEKWDFLFAGEAKLAFDQAKTWLTDEQQQNTWNDIVENLPQHLPLDNNRGQTYFNQIKKHLEKNTPLQYIANVKISDENIGGHPLTATICAPRIEFTVLGKQTRIHEIGTTWQAVRSLSEDELQYVVQAIVGHDQISSVPIQIQELNPDTLSQYVNQLQQANHTPTALIISSEQMRQIAANPMNLQIIESSRAQNWAILLNPSTGSWKSTPIQYTIEDCPNKSTHIHVKLSEEIEYTITDPNGIIVLELPSLT